jgi:hypothetical protein
MKRLISSAFIICFFALPALAKPTCNDQCMPACPAPRHYTVEQCGFSACNLDNSGGNCGGNCFYSGTCDCGPGLIWDGNDCVATPPPPPPVGYCGDGICQLPGENMTTCPQDCACQNVTGGNGAAGVCACNGIAICFSCCVSPSFNSCSPSNCALWTPPPPPLTPPPPTLPPPVPPSPPPPLSPPVITSANTDAATYGLPFNYQITATNSPTSWNATNLPAGLAIDTATGLISGLPTNAGSGPITLKATNAAGTGTMLLTLTVYGPCPTGTICGHITAREDGSDVPNATVQVKDTLTGIVVNSAVTDGSGRYAVSVPGSQAYMVIPAINRTENSVPSFTAQIASWSADFVEAGLKSIVKISGMPGGTYLLYSRTPYVPASAPVIRSGVGPYFTRVVGPDGNATASLPPGQTYFLTCWVPQDTDPVTFRKKYSVSIGTLAPRQSMDVACGTLP